MSNALAIATATAAFAQLIRTAVQSVLSGSDVLTERPDGRPMEQPRVRLFLYEVVSNTAHRNMDLPTRAADGALVKRPTAALDLHYLLSFYGSERELEPQRMLGAVVRDLHARPVLSREMINDAIAGNTVLKDSNLAEALDSLRFTPLPLSLEELSKLWSVMLQAPYALSIAYQGSVVLIDDEQAVRATPPVLTRGRDDRGINLFTGTWPSIQQLHVSLSSDPQRQVPSLPGGQVGSVLTIYGQHLDGDEVSVRFEHAQLDIDKTIVVEPQNRTETQIRIAWQDDTAALSEWAAGMFSVSVRINSHGTQLSTNRLPLVFAAKIKSITPRIIARDAQGTAELTIRCSPQVRSTQRPSLLIDNREVPAQPLTGDEDELTFRIQSAPVVTNAAVRLRVDGVDSHPILWQNVPPMRYIFDPEQEVTIS